MTPYYEQDGITIYCCDCRDILPAIEPGSVDLVLTDPPYNVGKRYGKYRDAMPEPDYGVMIREVFRLCVGAGMADLLWFWQGIRVANGEVPACLPDGFRIHHLAAWFKREFAGDLWKGAHPAFAWEPIVWATNRDKAEYHGPRGGHAGRDCLVGNSSRHDTDAYGHPCPKTLSVVRAVLDWTEGVVLDPFNGAGSILVAAKDLGRRAIGIEIEERYCEIAARRLAQGVFEFDKVTT